MSESGVVTTQVNGFTVTSNSGASEEQIRANLKGKVAEGASTAGRELGKLGAKAAAEKRAEAKAKAEEEPEAEKEQEPEKPAAEGDQSKGTTTQPKAKPEPEEEPEKEPEAKAEAEAEPEKEPEPEPEPPKPNPRHDPIARMREATRKEAEAKRALAEERQQRTALEARLAAIELRIPREAPAQPGPPKWNGQSKPSPDGFETYEEYLDARDEWNKFQWESGVYQRIQQSAAQRAIEAQRMKFRDVAAPQIDQYSEDVLSLRTEFQLGEGERPSGENWVANELFFSPESAPALMLHFTAHPQDLQRIAALTTPREVSREMAKLETRLEAAAAGNSSEREPAVSRAAPPVRPVTGRPYVTESTGYRPGMSLDEYARIRKNQRSR